MVCDGFLSLSGKTGCSVKLCGKGVKLMFSFVSSAKPGKHFLIQTEDEDGQLENGSVLNKNAGTDTCKLLFFKTCFFVCAVVCQHGCMKVSFFQRLFAAIFVKKMDHLIEIQQRVQINQ